MSNTEKLLAMLTSESIKVRESGNLKDIEDFFLEFERFYKVEVEKLRAERERLYIEALDGKEDGEVNGYKVSYVETSKRAVDPTKIDLIKDEDLKDLFFEKKSVTIAEAEKIIKDNKIDIDVFSSKQGKKVLKLK